MKKNKFEIQKLLKSEMEVIIKLAYPIDSKHISTNSDLLSNYSREVKDSLLKKDIIKEASQEGYYYLTEKGHNIYLDIESFYGERFLPKKQTIGANVMYCLCHKGGFTEMENVLKFIDKATDKVKEDVISQYRSLLIDTKEKVVIKFFTEATKNKVL
jgi:predicted transcriptional regulator